MTAKQHNEEIRHIVFDIGRVLLHYDPELAYLDLIPQAEERRWFLDNVCTPEWNIQQDGGRSWHDGESELISKFPNHESNIRAFRTNWHKMVPYAYEDSLAFMQELIGAGYDVTMLTNFAADTFEEAIERYPFLTSTRGVTVSGRIGMLKPERRIYETHAATFELDPSVTLFIDDSATNVDGARSAGWHSVQFTGVPELRSDLSALGIAV